MDAMRVTKLENCIQEQLINHMGKEMWMCITLYSKVTAKWIKILNMKMK